MTLDIHDEAFERALRGTLAALEPGDVPVALLASVAAVPRVARRERPAPRLLFALGGLAAVLVVAVIAIATLTRLPGPTPPIGTEPTPTAAPSAPSSLRLELVTDDVLAPSAAILDILDARLAAAGYDDATTGVAEGRFLVDVQAEPSDGQRILELLTAPGRVEALETGLDHIQPGTPIDRAAYTVLFSGDEVASADLVGVLAEPAGVLLYLDANATDRLAEYSGSHVGEMFTIAVDGVAVVVPMIQEAMTGGSMQLSLADGDDSALSLLAFLRSGPLPSPLRLAPEPAGQSILPGLPPTPAASETNSPTAGVSRATFTTLVQESCGSIGGCAYDVVLAGPGAPVRLEFNDHERCWAGPRSCRSEPTRPRSPRTSCRMPGRRTGRSSENRTSSARPR